jgi:hypothetical protein
MMGLVRKLLSKSKWLNAALGDEVFITQEERGAFARLFFEWCVRRSLDNRHRYIVAKIGPGRGGGVDDIATTALHFDLEAAVRLRDNLNDCIEFARRQSEQTGR